MQVWILRSGLSRVWRNLRENVKLCRQVKIDWSIIGVRKVKLNVGTVILLPDNPEGDNLLLRNKFPQCFCCRWAPSVSRRWNTIQATLYSLMTKVKERMKYEESYLSLRRSVFLQYCKVSFRSLKLGDKFMKSSHLIITSEFLGLASASFLT